MAKNSATCFNCGKKIDYEDDCWSTAFHFPFDTLLKIKKWSKEHCLCIDCQKKKLGTKENLIEKK